jgi:CheY-like chemotaxis protein
MGKGTGLGLASVYAVVKRAGGHITVSSEPGRGATFRVYFPRAQAALSARPSRPATFADHAGNETILVAEDESVVRELVTEILAASGYRVIAAHDGQDALERFRARTEDIDLVLSDVVMPRVSGGELARRVAQERPGVPVLFMSGYTGDELAKHGMRDGSRLLEKPFTPEALLDAVRRALAEREPVAARGVEAA